MRLITYIYKIIFIYKTSKNPNTQNSRLLYRSLNFSLLIIFLQINQFNNLVLRNKGCQSNQSQPLESKRRDITMSSHNLEPHRVSESILDKTLSILILLRSNMLRLFTIILKVCRVGQPFDRCRRKCSACLYK